VENENLKFFSFQFLEGRAEIQYVNLGAFVEMGVILVGPDCTIEDSGFVLPEILSHDTEEDNQ
jgi:hypothetical protein